jgi:protocadherin Fat 1/2/3
VYSLKSYSDKFTIDSDTGQIKTSADLTGIASKEFLTVVASNKQAVQGGPSDDRDRETTVEIYISSKAPPVCQFTTFTAKIDEALKTGSNVLKVIATAGGGANIRYSPVKANIDVDEKFSVSPSGQVTTASQLDYEILPENDKKFRLQVRAQEDGTNLFCTCDVEIELQDVNDDKPTFDLGSYDARVKENAQSGTDVMKVIAKDRDVGHAGKVDYKLRQDDNSQYFTIEPVSGLIKTKISFDREKKDKYSIVVIARDKGVPQLSEEVTVRILVVDENDQAPKFNQTKYETSVPENAPVGTKILQVQAIDLDVGDNAKLDYFISGGDTSGIFSVETVTSGGKTYGILVVDGKLDFETKSVYSVRVSATDGRTSDQTTVNIMVSKMKVRGKSTQWGG